MFNWQLLQRRIIGWSCAFGLLAGVVGTLRAAQYEVGPEREYKTLQQVAGKLAAGDVVMVDGGATYPGGVSLNANGLPGNVIKIEGRNAGGKRPILSGVTEKGQAVLRVLGSHYLIEGFDVTVGGDARAGRCFYNVGDDVTLRDCAVHDAHMTGIAGADASGSLTLDGVEICRCGVGLYAHQIYVGSGLAKYPDAVFRMIHCYVHDGAGGNNVKSRVTRNEIEYNWIEGAAFHELDLVGPDPKSQAVAADVHCDSDVIGKVLVKRPGSQGAVARLGTGGTGASRGQVRLAYNTVILTGTALAHSRVLWLEGDVRTVMAWNNVFWSDDEPLNLVGMDYGAAPIVGGGGNWWPAGTRDELPGGTVGGNEPLFRDASAGDYRPAKGSPLIGTGKNLRADIQAHSLPPVRGASAANKNRSSAQARDIGAFPSLPGD